MILVKGGQDKPLNTNLKGQDLALVSVEDGQDKCPTIQTCLALITLLVCRSVVLTTTISFWFDVQECMCLGYVWQRNDKRTRGQGNSRVFEVMGDNLISLQKWFYIRNLWSIRIWLYKLYSPHPFYMNNPSSIYRSIPPTQ